VGAMTAQKKVYKLDSVEQINFLMDKLDDDWRCWLLDGKPLMEIEVRFHKERRRLEQNDLYWAYLRDLSEQIAAQLNEEPHDVRVWDEFFKRTFLGIESHMLVDQPIEVVKAHKSLSIHDFSDYLDQVFHWGAEHDVVHEEAA
jgi:hypothetical protein